MEFQMLYRERLGQAEHDRAAQMDTGGFMLTAAEDNIVLIQPAHKCQPVAPSYATEI